MNECLVCQSSRHKDPAKVCTAGANGPQVEMFGKSKDISSNKREFVLNFDINKMFPEILTDVTVLGGP